MTDPQKDCILAHPDEFSDLKYDHSSIIELANPTFPSKRYIKKKQAVLY